jgi:hypothetical protein
MAAIKKGEMPRELARLRDRLTAWRSTRKRGARVPPALWKAAARLATVHGVSRTASVLGLAYYTLKEHMEHRSRSDSRNNTPSMFIELPSPVAMGECQAEFESLSGAKVRVRWSGTAAVNLADVVRTWMEKQ